MDPAARPDGLQAIIFDMDGVVTDTASLHAACWKQVFDQYLQERSSRTRQTFDPFSEADYLRYVDGKPRYEGAASFLWSRGFDVPWGRPTDPPSHRTVCAIANLKDRAFEELVRDRGAPPFVSTLRFIEWARAGSIGVALISSSRHARVILESSGLLDLFDVVIDGVEAEAGAIPGKPDPAIFLAAARQLGVAPGRAVVVEDALAGVEAGRRGGFGLVIGIDRRGNGTDLRRCGADIVVADLAELDPRSLVIKRPA